MSDNSEILIIQHLRRVVPRPEFLLFANKRASSVKQADLRDMLKKASNSVCTSTAVVSPDHLSSGPSTSSAMKTPENAEDLDDPEPADERDIQMEYASD